MCFALPWPPIYICSACFAGNTMLSENQAQTWDAMLFILVGFGVYLWRNSGRVTQ